LATRLAEHYTSREGIHAFCEGALGDVVGETGARYAWVALISQEVRMETLACFRGAGARGDEENEAWRAMVSVVSRLVAGDASLEQVVHEQRDTSAAVALRDGQRLFGALCLHLPETEGVPDGTSRLLVRVAQLLSAYLRTSVTPPGEKTPPRDSASSPRFPDDIVGRSSVLIRVLERLELIAPTEATVLIEGENGTGKELVARATHRMSGRADKPWVVVNCAAIPEQLLESELFGHERGAFTGAFERKTGRFEQADGGTIFLDEIGEMPLPLQAKLLRFLQERTLQRLGGGRDIPVDVRFVVATNRDLAKLKDEGKFREDLYWRLYVVPIRVPPLRERPEDVRLLAEHFVGRFARDLRREPPRIDPSVLECLESYSWPGNVRQLENLVHRMVILSTNGHLLRRDLPLEMRGDDRVARLRRPEPFGALLATIPGSYEELQDRRRDLLRLASRCAGKLEDQFVDRILERHNGNKSRAASSSGMHRTLIHRNLRKRGVSMTGGVAPTHRGTE
jgi:transcriptional regulator with GAF, ATPase, and Fis domain